MIGTAILILIVNALVALAVRSLIYDSSIEWINSKELRILMLIPPFGILSFIIMVIAVIVCLFIIKMGEYFND
jgi:hypothetical protein